MNDKADAQIIGEALGVLDCRPNLVKESQKKAKRYDNHVPVRRSWPLARHVGEPTERAEGR